MNYQQNVTTHYKPYTTEEIDTLINEPWEIKDRPYMLHAAYALNCIYELLNPEEEDVDAMSPDEIFGKTLPKNIINHLAEDIASDFNDAAANYKSIKIWGKSYAIKKVNTYDRKRLHLIFNFPINDDEYIITKEGILNLAGQSSEALSKYEITREQVNANRIYLRKIIKLAEDDSNNGWDQLTDMEIVIYCWAMFYNKYQFNNWLQFTREYKDYLYIKESEARACFTEKATLRQMPVGMYTFSYDKVKKWHDDRGLTSVADQIGNQEAEDYWYDVALKNTFKPVIQ